MTIGKALSELDQSFPVQKKTPELKGGRHLVDVNLIQAHIQRITQELRDVGVEAAYLNVTVQHIDNLLGYGMAFNNWRGGWKPELPGQIVEEAKKKRWNVGREGEKYLPEIVNAAYCISAMRVALSKEKQNGAVPDPLVVETKLKELRGEPESDQSFQHIDAPNSREIRSEKLEWKEVFERIKKLWDSPLLSDEIMKIINHHYGDSEFLTAEDFAKTGDFSELSGAAMIAALLSGTKNINDLVALRDRTIKEAVDGKDLESIIGKDRVFDVSPETMSRLKQPIILAVSPGGQLHNEEVVAKTEWSSATLGRREEATAYDGSMCLVMGFEEDHRYVFDILDGTVQMVEPERLKDFRLQWVVDVGE